MTSWAKFGFVFPLKINLNLTGWALSENTGSVNCSTPSYLGWTVNILPEGVLKVWVLGVFKIDIILFSFNLLAIMFSPTLNWFQLL